MQWTPPNDTTPDAPEAPGADAPLSDSLRGLTLSTGDDQRGAEGDSTGEPGRTWQHELPRWLATLDSERTRREYEKAVGYFFHTPGVPQTLAALTFDLLLAYRGSLALRAERQARVATAAPAAPPTGAPRLVHTSREALPRGAATGATGDNNGDQDPPADPATNARAVPPPLAPATVNIRLTALRQFLAHCSLWGHLPDLPPERMRAALRRLRIERRRPYQILAEPEWGAFLRAAEAPRHAPRHAARTQRTQMVVPASHGDRDDRAGAALARTDATARTGALDTAPNAQPATESPAGDLLHGSRWGMPRATRRQQNDQRHPASSINSARTPPSPPAMPTLARARSGLTGAFTAQRDHALLALALATGLRAIELCALDLGDLAREWNAGVEEWWLILPDAKTKGQHGGRTLPLAPALVTTLLTYVGASGRAWSRATDRATPLFLSHHYAKPGGPDQPPRATPAQRPRPAPARGRLSPQQVRRIVDRVETQWLGEQQSLGAGECVDGGTDGRAISPHALRHSTAVALLEGNEPGGRAPASVEHVRGWLGHFDIRTTQGYLAHLDARRHRRPFTLQPVAESPAGTAPEAAPSSPPSGDPAADAFDD